MCVKLLGHSSSNVIRFNIERFLGLRCRVRLKDKLKNFSKHQTSVIRFGYNLFRSCRVLARFMHFSENIYEILYINCSEYFPYKVKWLIK